MSKKPFAYAEDNEVFDMILDGAVGPLDEDSNIPSFVAKVLRTLGLLITSSDNCDYIPTKQLRWLAAGRHQKARRQRDDLRQQKSNDGASGPND